MSSPPSLVYRCKSMNYQELIQLLDSYSSRLLGKFPHRYQVFDLTLKCNYNLKYILQQDGYWNFAPSRSQCLVGYHQIVAFYLCAKDKPRGSGDLVEVHHLDGNTMNNLPSNLVYLSPNDHALCTKYQRRASKLSLKLFASIGKKGKRCYTPFNKQGKLVRNWARFILAIICSTVYLTTRWNTKYWDNPLTLVKSFISVIERGIRSLIHVPSLQLLTA